MPRHVNATRRLERPVTYRQDKLFGSPPLPILAGVYEMDGDHKAHAHDFLEIAVVSRGRGTHMTAGGTDRARPGRVFILRPGTWHAFLGCQRLAVANCCLGVTGLAIDLASLREIPELRTLLWTEPMAEGQHGVLAISIPAETARETAEQIRHLGVELRRPDANPVLLMSYLLGVLAKLIPRESASATSGTRRPAVVDTVVRALDSAPESPWTAKQLAALAGLSPEYLTRLFRRHVGLTPIAYLTRIRAERAAVLLTRTDLPVAEIGRSVGWSDPNYFARRFRAVSDLSPTVYRKTARHESASHGPVTPAASPSGDTAPPDGSDDRRLRRNPSPDEPGDLPRWSVEQRP